MIDSAFDTIVQLLKAGVVIGVGVVAFAAIFCTIGFVVITIGDAAGQGLQRWRQTVERIGDRIWPEKRPPTL